MPNEKKLKRRLQIGVMGSAADLKYSKKIEKIAEEIKQELKNEIVWVLNSGTGLALEDWIIFAQEYSNEDDIFSSFMYECAELLNTDLFKFKCAGY